MVGPLRGGRGVTPPTTKMEKIHREAAQWKYYFVKYDILVQIFTSVHSILSVYTFTGSKTIFAKKKSDFFSPKILEFFFVKIRFRLL